MKWEQFLTHPEIRDVSHSIPIGKYLFGKILHDLLECLNGYKGFTKIILDLNEPNQNIQATLIAWNQLVDKSIAQLNQLWEFYQNESFQSDWGQLIEGAGKTIPQDLFQIANQLEILSLESTHWPTLLLERAMNHILQLKFICQDIKNQEYVQLWKY